MKIAILITIIVLQGFLLGALIAMKITLGKIEKDNERLKKFIVEKEAKNGDE